MKSTTYENILAARPCGQRPGSNGELTGWLKLLENTGRSSGPVSFIEILDSNGFEDALWCCRAASEYDREWRLLAVSYARDVQHLMTDARSLNALDVAERFANGEATRDELSEAAEAAARAAAEAAEAAEAAAWAAWAAAAARAAAEAAAAEAAEAAAAWAAAWAAAEAAAAEAAEAAGSDLRDRQITRFRELVG